MDLAELVDETHLAVVGVADARGIETQREELGETPHGWIGMRFIIERVTLGAPREGPESGRELLVARLVGAIVRLFGLARQTVRGLIRRVVGVGMVVVAHKPRNHDSQPRTLQLSIPSQPATSPPGSPPRSGLVQQGEILQPLSAALFPCSSVVATSTPWSTLALADRGACALR